jgi:hypothetical protein
VAVAAKLRVHRHGLTRFHPAAFARKCFHTRGHVGLGAFFALPDRAHRRGWRSAAVWEQKGHSGGRQDVEAPSLVRPLRNRHGALVAFAYGHRFHILAIVAEVTRKCLPRVADTSLPGQLRMQR